jgi:hypothetical protein
MMADATAHPAGQGVKITHKITMCEDRHCPTVWATADPDVFAVQGALVKIEDKPQGMPLHEDVVLIPRSVLLEGAAAADPEAWVWQ